MCSLALTASSLLAAGCGEDETTTSATAPEGGLSVRVKPREARAGGTVKAIVLNETDRDFTYGAGAELQREVGGEYEIVEQPQRPVPGIGYVAPAGEEGPPVEVRLQPDLESGDYRVVLTSGPEGEPVAGDFEVVGRPEVIDG